MPIPTPSTDARDDASWWSASFLLVLFVQACFSLGWSTFFLVPKLFAERFGLSGGAILSLSAVPSIGALVAVPFVGWALDRYGRRRFIAAGSAMVAVAALGFAHVDRAGPLAVVLLVLEGVGFVFAWNAAAALAADLAPPARLGRVIGVFGAANLSMNAVAPWIGEKLAAAYGWEAPFLAASGACASAVLFSATLRAGTRRAPSGPSPAGIGAARAGESARSLARVYAGAGLFAVTFTAVFSLQAPFALREGVTEVGDFFVGFTVAALATRLFLGGLVDRYGARIVSVLGMTAYATAPIALFVLGPAHLALAGAILGACHGVLFPSVMALAIERSDASSRGRAMTFVHGAFNLGSIATGFVLGAAADRFGYGPAFGVASAATLLGAAITSVRGAGEDPARAVGGVTGSAR